MLKIKLVKDVFVINKTENTVPWTYVIEDFHEEKIVGTFYRKELQKTNQTLGLKK